MARAKHGKRWRQDAEKAPRQPVSVDEAVKAIKSFSATKFDQTVELVCNLGVDPRQADQNLRGSLSLPNGIGKSKRVIAFCDSAEAEKARQAGAVEAGSDDLIKKVNDGWLDFDVAVATPAMMRSVSRLGRVLGPQGKMPSPKNGTVTDDVVQAVREFGAGRIEFRTDAGGNVHVPVGKVSFEDAKLAENVDAFVAHLRRIKPTSSKGTYFKRTFLTATMSPSVPVDVK